MNTIQGLKKKSTELYCTLVQAMDEFSEANPDMPVEFFQAELGKLFVQLSLRVSDQSETLRLIDGIRDVVITLRPQAMIN
ncbi:MAG TPA: hypothetical protein VF450_10255 [Noviherbaspirillum sp.]